MPKYRFTGTTTEWFVSLGKELSPGDIVETVEDVEHARMELVKSERVKPDTKPTPAASTAADTTVKEA